MNVLFLIHFDYEPGFGTEQHGHVDCSTSTLLLIHLAPTECSSGSLQQFIRRHSPRSSFLVPLRTFYFASLASWKATKSESFTRPPLIPTLYVGKVEDILGRVPLFPCFLDGNITSTIEVTIPYKCAA